MPDAPGLIDSFLVELRIDASKLSEDQKKAAAAQAAAQKKMLASAAAAEAEMGKRLSESFRHIRNEALGLFALVLGARSIKDFVVSATQTEIALGNLAVSTGASIRTLSAFEMAVKSQGGTMADAAGFITGLNNTLKENALSAMDLPEALYRFDLGGAFGGDNLDTMKAYFKLVKAVEQSAMSRPEKAHWLDTLPGMTPSVRETILLGVKENERLFKEKEALAPTPDDIKKSREVTAAWSGATDAVNKFGAALLALVGTDLADFLKDFKTWVDVARETTLPYLQEKVKEFTDWVHAGGLKPVGEWITWAAEGVNKFVNSLGGWRIASDIILSLWMADRLLPG